MLQADKANAKALFRRGRARARLGQGDAARADLQQAASLSPADAAIKRELAALSRCRPCHACVWSGVHGPSSALPSHKAPFSSAADSASGTHRGDKRKQVHQHAQPGVVHRESSAQARATAQAFRGWAKYDPAPDEPVAWETDPSRQGALGRFWRGLAAWWQGMVHRLLPWLGRHAA